MSAAWCQGQFQGLRTRCSASPHTRYEVGTVTLCTGQGTLRHGVQSLVPGHSLVTDSQREPGRCGSRCAPQLYCAICPLQWFKNPPNYYIKWRDDSLQVQQNWDKSLSTLTAVKERKHTLNISNEIEIISINSGKPVKNHRLILYKTWCCHIGKSGVQDDVLGSFNLPKLTQRQETGTEQGPRAEWDSCPWILADLEGTDSKQVNRVDCEGVSVQKGGQMQHKIKDQHFLTDQQSPIQGVRIKEHTTRGAVKTESEFW